MLVVLGLMAVGERAIGIKQCEAVGSLKAMLFNKKSFGAIL